MVDGFIVGDAGENITRTTVLRAPLHCDGSMGAFVDTQIGPARGSYWGNAVAFGGQPLVLNGQSDTPPHLVDSAFLGVPGVGGSLASYLSTNGVVAPVRWRMAVAATASHAYVIGGEGVDTSPTILWSTGAPRSTGRP